MRQRKIFGVGFQKTGTKSLQIGLGLLGLRCEHGFAINLPDKRAVTVEAPLSVANVLPEALKRIGTADAFCDNPWPLLYRELDSQFPGAKFILTTRSPQSWRKSIETHFRNRERGATDIHVWLYGDAAMRGDFDRCVAIYEAHNAAVREHFRDRPNDFLEIDVTVSDPWPGICGLIGVPIPRETFPHVNVTRKSKRTLERLLLLLAEREVRLKRRFRIARARWRSNG